jgi:RNA polymerase sigma factor (sigma-70 family)
MLDMYVGSDVLSQDSMPHDEQYRHLCLIHKDCTLGKHVEKHTHDSRGVMVVRNMRLVINVAQRFISSRSHLFADVVAAGTVGLMYGIDKFDVHKRTESGQPYRFSTYAVWWIGSLIRDEITLFNHRIVRRPSKRDQLNRMAKEFKLLTGREPTPEDMIAYATKTGRWTIDMVCTILAEQENRIVSLTEAVNTTCSKRGVLSEIVENESIMRLRAAINQLDVSEVYVLMRRYASQRTLGEIADEFGVSSEWVRQVENAALGKLWLAMEPEGHTESSVPLPLI